MTLHERYHALKQSHKELAERLEHCHTVLEAHGIKLTVERTEAQRINPCPACGGSGRRFRHTDEERDCVACKGEGVYFEKVKRLKIKQ